MYLCAQPGLVVQLNRTSDSGSEGRGFESLRGHKTSPAPKAPATDKHLCRIYSSTGACLLRGGCFAATAVAAAAAAATAAAVAAATATACLVRPPPFTDREPVQGSQSPVSSKSEKIPHSIVPENPHILQYAPVFLKLRALSFSTF